MCCWSCAASSVYPAWSFCSSREGFCGFQVHVKNGGSPQPRVSRMLYKEAFDDCPPRICPWKLSLVSTEAVSLCMNTLVASSRQKGALWNPQILAAVAPLNLHLCLRNSARRLEFVWVFPSLPESRDHFPGQKAGVMGFLACVSPVRSHSPALAVVHYLNAFVSHAGVPCSLLVSYRTAIPDHLIPHGRKQKSPNCTVDFS